MVTFDEYGVPYADKECDIAQAEYEAALGRFLVLFNAVENMIGQLLEMVLEQKGLPTLAAKLTNGESLSKKLDLLKSASIDVSEKFQNSIPFVDIKELSEKRNALAHGHFDINPHDASFTIVGKKELKDVNSEFFDSLVSRSNDMFERLRYCYAYLCFDDVTIIKP